MIRSNAKTIIAVISCLLLGLLAAALYYAITVQMATGGLQPMDPSASADEMVFVSISFFERLIAPFSYGSLWEFWYRDFPFFSVVAILGMVVGYLLAKPRKAGS